MLDPVDYLARQLADMQQRVADLERLALPNQALDLTSSPTFAGLTLSGLGAVTSGTYTPTLTNVANIAAKTAYLCGYLRVGNSVLVFGVVTIQPTAAASTLTQLGCSLPIASALSDALQAGGTFVSTDAFFAGAIESDAANDRVQFTFYPTVTTNRNYRFTFGYQVI